MIWRGVPFFLLVCLNALPAYAGDLPRLHRVSCVVVRYYVAKYTAPAAESWARSRGATDSEIESARHCLKVIHTAQQ
ncbi:hypothetical protein HAP48_0039465 [Bradyrhizobium septentrionale]|uniref:hypothetical protein n=1 Tax=Bradyrhizobium septentrionale TaxID=1404411 RepID=UPI001CCA67C1|nr:hypothetical protein [Bradyrhizobium septentrionale]UGY14565.1 hypothetical protein HAP48_0039465 [Bradyrhizobium septentrionale]